MQQVSIWCLEWQTDCERFNESIAGVVHADEGKEKPEADNEIIERDIFLLQQVPFELQVEVARPDEA